MYNHRSIIVGIVSGESSGDIIGSGLMKSLKKYLKEVYFFGIGGPLMCMENMECWYNINDLSVMGITEIIYKLPNILKIRRDLINRFLNLKPDVFIGIDFPDFNIFLEKCLKKEGICTIHYVSPSIWAWRMNRIFDLKQATDNILVLFPFEKLIYDYFGIPCQLVGHTLADQIPLYPNKYRMREKLGIDKNKYYLALFPGSRIQEIKMLAYDFLICSTILRRNFINLEVLVLLNSQILIDQFIKMIPLSVKCHILNSCKSWEVMSAADISLLAAGTVSLECMLAKCPMVVAYRINPITFILIKKLIKTSWISLPNLLAGRNLVQECIQHECYPEKLAKNLSQLLKNDNNQRTVLYKEFQKLHRSIRMNADDRAACTVLQSIRL